ncbi:NAD(P)-dependent oxidoreductase [Pelistega sp. MC2]|uniref:NAD(P)-dependent oxidoreductase n=1 Tax=Pelistega sp. MC2 TaxID=1720297 RepID=UPI0008D8EB2D|nr:NAD(P)-dependent oxidoreductase [Pelistega sp. MC2]
MSEQQSIGIIGVGLMGHGIASNIVKHGHSLTILNHSGNQPVDILLSQGAKLVDSVAELAKSTQVIILCVTGSPQVESIFYQEDGLLANLREGSIVIDCSTAIPTSTVKLAKAVQAKKAFFIDAPMTRTPKEAAEGRLNLIVGGDEEIFLRVKPLLNCFAENIVYAGKVGTGHRLKLIHNFVSLGFTAVLSEAVAAARKADIDANVLIDILDAGGGQGVVLNRMKPYIQSNDDSSFRFALSNAYKDLSYYTEMTTDNHDYQVVAEAIKQTFASCLAEKPAATLPEIVSLLAQKG